MHPMRIRVRRIIDFGVVVAIIGTDADSGSDVAVQVDHRPLGAILQTWKSAGLSEDASFVADSLMLLVDVAPEGLQPERTAA